MVLFTVEQLVNHPDLPGLKIMAGKRSANNAISGANIIDNPDTYDWLNAGDFLLTTGYVFKDNIQMQYRMVQELSQLNCAGVGIKIKRYWDEIPQRILKEAEKLGLPIVQIPFKYSLSDIINVINNEIFKRQDTLLKKYMDSHNAFMKCSLNGGGLDEIAELASLRIGNPIIIVDSKWQLLAYSEHKNNTERLADHMDLTLREKPFSREFTQGIPDSVDKFTISIKRIYPNEKGHIICRIIPIATDKIIYGYIVVWETVKKMTQTEYITLEMAATISALERVKARQIEETRHRMKKDFFDDLLQNRIASVNAVNSLAEIHGMDTTKSHICAVLKLQHTGNDDIEKEHAKIHEIIDFIYFTAKKCKRKITVIHRENLIIMFIQVNAGEDSVKPDQNIRDFLQTMDVNLKKLLPSLQYIIGVSNVCKEFLSISKAFMRAQEVLRISQKLNCDSTLFYFSDLMNYHLLDNSFDKEQLKIFSNFYLGRLIDYDKQNGTQLIETLESYFKAGCNVSIAAKNMYIHRNTFIYRMNKIKSILKSEINDSEEILNLQLALMIIKLL